MADLSSAIASDIAGYYEFIAAHVHKWVDPLTQGSVLAQSLPLRK